MRTDRQPSTAESEVAGASSRPDASIVIVSWNAKLHLLDCLRSIEANAGAPGIEIIVVDNASSDGGADAVAREFPRVLLVRNAANLGFARAGNIGIERASGRYVFLVNSDTVVGSGAIAVMIRFMDDHADVGFAGPRVLNADGTLQHSCRHFPGIVASTSNTFALHRLFPRSHRLSGEMMLHWAHDSERSVDAISGCFCVARVAAVRQIGGLDETFFMYGEDVDWCMRFHAAGWDVRFYPGAEVLHFGGVSSASDRPRFVGEMLTSISKLYRKHYSRPVAAYLVTMAVVYHVVRLVPRLALYALRPSQRALQKVKIDEHLGAVRWLFRGDG